MRAKHTTQCNICEHRIWKGQPIEHIQGIGWVHLGCSVNLERPVPGSSVFSTMREKAEYTFQVKQNQFEIHDTFMETPDPDPFG